MVPFRRSARALETDRSHVAPVLAIVSVLIGLGWCGWSILADVPLMVTSVSARLESASEVHAVEAPVAGTVGSVAVHLGQWVEAGDVLVELDPSLARSRRLEDERRRDALLGQIEGIDTELDVLEALLRLDEAATRAERAEARSHLRAMTARSRLANREQDRARALVRSGAVSTVEVETLESQAEQTWAERQAVAARADRLGHDARRRVGEVRVRIAQLQTRRFELEGEAKVAAATIARLDTELEAHVVRSPVAGVVGELARIQVGAVLDVGDQIASVIPPGDLRISAEFRPADVSGRVAVGSRAEMRLEGFSWLRHGFVHGRVSRVASEVRDGTLRVDLEVDRVPGTVEAHHGLPGTVEVEVERLSPLQLLLHRAGDAFRGDNDGPTPVRP